MGKGQTCRPAATQTSRVVHVVPATITRVVLLSLLYTRRSILVKKEKVVVVWRKRKKLERGAVRHPADTSEKKGNVCLFHSNEDTKTLRKGESHQMTGKVRLPRRK